jgi:TatD DNase family protein
MTGLIDIGANLAHDSFDPDRAEVLDRAWDAGLEAIIITGSSADSACKALDLARAHGTSTRGRLYATAGLHPHHANDWTPELGALFRELAAEPQVVALGECGLDYNRNYSPHPAQRTAFIAQLQLAAALKKPLFLHQRDAHTDFIAILREYRAALIDVCVHCFTDTREALEDCLALDCHIGITGWICDERRGRHLLELSSLIPDDRLMIETDAPYLLPRTAPRPESRRNEPCYLPWVVRSLAQARKQSEVQVGASSRDNARRFFRLDSE